MSLSAQSELGQTNESSKVKEEIVSPWSPLTEPIFRALWIATVASNIGTWMQDVGESWLMVSLTTSPMLVALVETAGSLPIVLLALPAGAKSKPRSARVRPFAFLFLPRVIFMRRRIPAERREHP